MKDTVKGENAIDGVINKVGQLGERLMDMAFDAAIQGLLSSLVGAFTVGGVGGIKGLPGLGGFSGSAVKIPGFVNGTNFAPGGLALVGERGPELVNLPRGSQVFPDVDRAMGGMANQFVVNASSEQSGADIVRQFDAYMRTTGRDLFMRWQRNPGIA